MPSGITQKDPLVLGQEISEGVLTRSGHPHAVATQTTPQARHPPPNIPTLTVARHAPRPQPACRSTPVHARRLFTLANASARRSSVYFTPRCAGFATEANEFPDALA